MASENQKYIFSPNFELQTKIKDGKERKTLIIFDDEYRTFCYSYFFVASENIYKCLGCFLKRTVVSARIAQNGDGEEEYVIHSNVKHLCFPRIYVKQNENIMQSLIYADETHQMEQILKRLTVLRVAEKGKKLQDLESAKPTFKSTALLNQNWPLPDTIIFYMAKNPSLGFVYQNLIECCKYFFIKNPIIVVKDLTYNNNGQWLTNCCEDTFYFSDISKKVWATRNIAIESNKDRTIASSIIPKLYRCDPDNLRIVDQFLSLNDFCFLASTAYFIKLGNVTVTYDDGSIVPFEKVFEKLSNIKRIKIESNQPISNVSFSTFKELIRIPQFSKLEYFWMNCIPEDFDIDAFYVYMKKNKLTKFSLYFDASIPQFYKNQLDRIIDEICLMKNYCYKAPFIQFPGMLPEKWDIIQKI